MNLFSAPIVISLFSIGLIPLSVPSCPWRWYPPQTTGYLNPSFVMIRAAGPFFKRSNNGSPFLSKSLGQFLALATPVEGGDDPVKISIGKRV